MLNVNVNVNWLTLKLFCQGNHSEERGKDGVAGLRQRESYNRIRVACFHTLVLQTQYYYILDPNPQSI